MGQAQEYFTKQNIHEQKKHEAAMKSLHSVLYFHKNCFYSQDPIPRIERL